jgi:AMP phosphorylase
MKMTVKDLDISTGDVMVVVLNERDAERMDIHPMDRVLVSMNGRKAVAVLDIAESERAVPLGSIGLMEEVLDELQARDGDSVTVEHGERPKSVGYIRKKLDGKQLNYDEMFAIVDDIVNSRLTDVELASYVAANYTHGMNLREVIDLTKAMTLTGNVLTWGQGPIADVHGIGGVPGNRTTMVVVPMLIAAGLKLPKTASRAITSPAGTADTMEVLCPVTLPVPKLKAMVQKVGGFIIWGGAVNLAPADDRIIRVEHPLSIDAEGQMLASIMAKKASVSATHLLMEIPLGPGCKAATRAEGEHLAHHFTEIGEHLKIKVRNMLFDGSQPIGRGIGPVLEAQDCIRVLKNDPAGPQDLRNKSIRMTATMLEFMGRCPKGAGLARATELLKSGAAWKAMQGIIEGQGGDPNVNPDSLRPGPHAYTYRAPKAGIVTAFHNKSIARIGRMAGAPRDKEAGVLLYRHRGDRVAKGEPLYTVYAKNKTDLGLALETIERLGGGIDIKAR